jgi:hypothetical protein
VSSPDEAADAAIREVVDLHAFFEAWLGGTCPASDEVLSGAEGALGPSFTMVAPDGRRLSRADTMWWLRQAHGAKGRSGPFRIAVVEPKILHRAEPLVVVGYIEEQWQGSTHTRRRASAVLERSPDGDRWQWVSVHETWIAPPG